MSDIYVPGIRSRFNTDQIVEDLMSLERIPRDRVANNVESLQTEKGYWQEVGKRIKSLRDSANFLYSFQNPFNDRIAKSGNDSVITANATREASEQSYSFTVKQTAQADRFLSQPLDEKMKIDAGKYIFTIGSKEEIIIDFRGGTLRDFTDTINRRGNNKISASLLAVQSGTRSLLLESKVTGTENRLGFSGDLVDLTMRIGMMEQGNDNRNEIAINANTVRAGNQNASNISVNNGVINVPARSSAVIPLNMSLSSDSPFLLKLETQTRTQAGDTLNINQPPPGPSISSGSVEYGGITIENEPSTAPLPGYKPPAPIQRHDSMEVLSLVFSDGSAAKLSPITDSNNFTTRQYLLSDIAQGRTITSINIDNTNTHREISVGNIEIIDPSSLSGGLKPLNPVSTARDAIITMEGIEIKRSSNNIDDLIPGITLNVKGISERPVDINIEADLEGIKEAIISFVGNYNRLLAEINVLTSSRSSTTPDMPRSVIRGDERVIEELTYLTKDEAAQMKERLGAFSGDVTLTTLKNNLMRTISAPYPTDLERELSLLAQIGISTNASRSTGYEVSRLRGYLEIDEKALDAALEMKVPEIRQLFANDTSGDFLADTGVAYNIDTLMKPFNETGGIIALKTNTIDSKISQDEKRIANLDRQLASKEAELKIQYARMESAYSRMESMSNSLDNFSQQNRSNR